MTTAQPAPPYPGDKYQATAAVLRDLLGGSGNITALEHCVTRLRLSLTERSLVNDTALRDHPAVLGVLERDTFQIIVGPAAVAPLTAALRHLLGPDADS
ncbi:PTS glucose/sucrose transporter subunit IIB [Streptomyces sp. NBC_01476]|uniref:PTS glucose/sucrose transporter subunit IIB n=1 Tax=Streptomyces sp. NBC_01476 TaxID=2903881 RepID=UPI002E31791D|nr:PTS glucose/sucrose transporter subunit IIB [Streptomyces sp. NBC_01476]